MTIFMDLFPSSVLLVFDPFTILVAFVLLIPFLFIRKKQQVVEEPKDEKSIVEESIVEESIVEESIVIVKKEATLAELLEVTDFNFNKRPFNRETTNTFQKTVWDRLKN